MSVVRIPFNWGNPLNTSYKFQYEAATYGALGGYGAGYIAHAYLSLGPDSLPLYLAALGALGGYLGANNPFLFYGLL